MKKVILVFLVSLMVVSLVLAASGDAEAGQQAGATYTTSAGNAGSYTTGSDTTAQRGQGTGNGTQTNTELQTKNQGENSRLQNQVGVQSGNYETIDGKQIRVQVEAGNELRLKVGNVEAKSSMQIGSEHDPIRNRTMLKTRLSNGKNAEIKVMPDVASEKAIERLRLKVCSSENNCQIELKEVGNGEQIKVVYEVRAQKEGRILGIFKNKMQVRAQVDAETGEIIQAKKPWWAFIVVE